MQHKLIKTEKEYNAYSKRVWELSQMKPSKKTDEEIELLDLLIEKWEQEHSKTKTLDPIQLLKYLMENRHVERDALTNALDIDKSTLSLILTYQRGLSKNVIRKLSKFFKMSQEAFNKEYELVKARDYRARKENIKATKKPVGRRIA